GIVRGVPIFIPGEKVGELEDLRGFRPLPGSWTVDWSLFLDGAPGKAKKPLSGKKLGAPEPTPLWFYVLKESGLKGGQRLGPVGGEIVAEVLLGLLKE